MTNAIDTSGLSSIANVTLEQFKNQYKSGHNVAAAYYAELATQGTATGNSNITNYAILAESVTTNSGSNGQMANAYSESVASDSGVTFPVGSDAWLKMQYELIQNDLAARNFAISRGEIGELNYEQTNNIHTKAFSDVGLPPETYTLYTPTDALGAKDPALAQALFEDLISDAGLGDNMFADGLGIDILNDWADTTSIGYWNWLGHVLEAIYNDPSILGSAAAEEFQDFKDAIGLNGVLGDYGWAWDNPGALWDGLKGEIPSWLAPIVGMQVGNGSVFFPAGGGGGMEPLILDLNGNGAHTTKLGWVEGQSSTYFDMDNDGFAERTAWVAAGDGMLVIDKNGNGKIDNQNELFGNNATYADGFANLKQYDSNNDNKITSADAQFSQLRVWVDANGDGKTDKGELKTLADLKISQINLAATYLTNTYDQENEVGAKSTFIMDGQSQEIIDAWFRIDQTDSHYTGNVTLDVRTLFLPTLKGFGDVKDMHVAMSQDATLLSLMQDLVATTTSSSFLKYTELDSKVQAILFRWVGVDGIASDATTQGLNTRMNVFLQKMTGYPGILENVPADQNVGPFGSPIQSTMFWRMFNQLKALLLNQIVGHEFFDKSTYNLATGELNEVPHISEAGFAKIAADLESIKNPYDDLYYWSGLTNFLIHIKGLEKYTPEEISKLNELWGGAYGFDWSSYASNQYFSFGWVFNGSQMSDRLMGTDNAVNYIWGLGGDDYIYGGATNDILSGGEGNDHIYGQEGGDSLDGGNGDDVINAGLGINIVNGGAGDDTYIYGGGVDTITEGGGIDQIVFNSVVYTNSTITLERDPNAKYALNILVDGKLAIVSFMQFASWVSSWTTIEQIVMPDGTVVDLTQLKNVDGTAGSETLIGLDRTWMSDDYIYGNGGNDIFKGGQGNDVLVGGYGNDTYVYNSGEGTDVIKYDFGGVDTLVLGLGYNAQNISFERVGSGHISGSEGNDLLIKSGNQTIIRIDGQFNGINTIEFIKFDDGSVLNLANRQYTFNGTSGSDTLYGTNAGSGNDTINGYDGNDSLYGYNGDDIINGGDGNDYIEGGSGNDILSGGSGDNYIFSSYGDDIVIYTGGKDTLTERYMYDAGGGIDTIKIDLPNITLADISLKIADLSTNDLNVMIKGKLAITIQTQFYETSQFEKIELADGSFIDLTSVKYAINGTYAADSIRGISYGGNPDDLINAGDGDDRVYSGLGNDRINGGVGTDTLEGGDGNDTYVINFGQGADILRDKSGYDVIQFGSGFDKAQMSFSRSPTASKDLQIMFGGNLAATIDGYFLDKGNIETLRYSDGSTYQLSNVVFSQVGTPSTDNLLGHNGIDSLFGFSGNDSLTGYAGNDILEGGTGNDTLQGGAGNDTYKFSVGDGVDTIYETSGTDLILMGAGITSANIRLEKSNNDLNIYYGTSDKINLSSQFYDDTYGTSYYDEVETLKFSDGTSINLKAGLTFTGTTNNDTVLGTSLNDKLFGLSGNDYLYGYAGNDVLEGGTGNDYLSGAAGNDTYKFSLGDGVDTIYETSGTDLILMGAGITSANIRLEKSNNDLNIYYGTSDKIILSSQFYDDTYGTSYYDEVETLKFSDGSSINLKAGLTFTGTNASNSLYGTSLNDTLIGLEGNDYLYGYAGNDIYIGGAGDDSIAGGGGTDTALYSSNFSSYTIIAYSGYLKVKDNLGTDGTDTLYSDVEKIQFADGIYESGHFTPLKGLVNFSSSPFTSYSAGQDLGGSVNVTSAENYGVELSGNAWKKIAYNYTVTSNTVVEFDYKSTIQGELQGFALETDNNFQTGAKIIQLYGTDKNVQYFDRLYDYDGSGDWQHFMVSASDYLTGPVSSIAFINDHDLGAQNANSFYQNFRIYERESQNVIHISHSSGSASAPYTGTTGYDLFEFDSLPISGQHYDINNFDIENDTLDLSSLIEGFDPVTKAINDFIEVTASGSDTTLRIDQDGRGTTHDWKQVAVIHDVSGLHDEQSLLNSGTINI